MSQNQLGYRCNACAVDVNNLQKHEATARHQKVVASSVQARKPAPPPPPPKAAGKVRGKVAKRPVKAPTRQRRQEVEQEYDEEDGDYEDEEDDGQDEDQGQQQGQMSRKEQSKFEKLLGERVVDLLNTDPQDYDDEDYRLLEFLKQHISKTGK